MDRLVFHDRSFAGAVIASKRQPGAIIMTVTEERGGDAKQLLIFLGRQPRRHRLAGGGKFEPVVRLRNSGPKISRAALLRFRQMTRYKFSAAVAKKRRGIQKKLAG